MSTALIGSARRFAHNVSGLAQYLRQAVVEVRCGGSGSGTGILWGGAGLVVTNAHCVAHVPVWSITADGESHAARVLAIERAHDLALLGVATMSGPLMELRNPDSVRIGELVFAHGHPLGVRNALALGVLTSIMRAPETGEPRWLMSDVKLAPGNSGGPLVDCEGRLLGINSMVVNGLGAAIPAALVQRFVEQALNRRAA
jgi:serine protease Do